MDEKRIERVVEIEKHAQEIYDAAARDAQQLPIQAEQDGQVIVEQARAAAQAEGQKLVAQAQAEQETGRIVSEAAGRTKETEALAKKNFDRAVNYILDQLVGGQ
jgi:vacuolar-type H+-ATPase subunit H